MGICLDWIKTAERSLLSILNSQVRLGLRDDTTSLRIHGKVEFAVVSANQTAGRGLG